MSQNHVCFLFHLTILLIASDFYNFFNQILTQKNTVKKEETSVKQSEITPCEEKTVGELKM